MFSEQIKDNTMLGGSPQESGCANLRAQNRFMNCSSAKPGINRTTDTACCLLIGFSRMLMVRESPVLETPT